MWQIVARQYVSSKKHDEHFKIPTALPITLLRAYVLIWKEIAMSTEIKNCELCKIKIDVTGFTLQTSTGLKAFCCVGCKCIYDIFHSEAEHKPLYDAVEWEAGSSKWLDWSKRADHVTHWICQSIFISNEQQ